MMSESQELIPVSSGSEDNGTEVEQEQEETPVVAEDKEIAPVRQLNNIEIHVDHNEQQKTKRRAPAQRGSLVKFTAVERSELMAKGQHARQNLIHGIIHGVNVIRKMFPKPTFVRGRAPSLEEPADDTYNLKDFEDVDLLAHTIGVWSKDVATPSKDIPRLVNRVTVKKGGVVVLSPELQDSVNRTSTAEQIVALVKVLSEHLESEEDAEAAGAKAEALLTDVSDEADLSHFTENVLETIGVESKCCKVLKCISQSIISQARIVLQQAVLHNLMTKDVRSQDGWTVEITLADYVQVRHKKRGQSMELTGNHDNHWEYTWEYALSFDKELREMTDVRLRITNLELSDSMDDNLAKKLTDIMQGGNLMIQ